MAPEKEHSRVFEKVKSMVSGGAARQTLHVSGLNLPWLLARCDCAYREMIPLLRGSIFIKETTERGEYYAMLLDMVKDMLNSLNLIYRETQRSVKGRKIEPDPCLPVLNVIHQTLQVLHQGVLLSAELQARQPSSAAFAGVGVISKFNGIEDTVSNGEVELFHNLSELLDSIAPAMQRASEQRKKSLSKSGMECYLRAEKELTQYYGLDTASSDD